MTTTPQTYKIRNVEGVADLTVDLHPGVNVLTGENEAGKTSAIRAITRASGATDQPLALRDGAANGSVRGPGVMLNVGKKVRTTGQPTVTLADYGSLAALVDPPIKGRAARDKARLRALLDLLPQALTERDLLELASGEEEVVAGVQGVDLSKVDLLEGAAKVGEMAHALARDYEGRRDEARGAARNASENLATLDLEGLERPPLGVEELEMTLEASVGRLTRARDGAEQRKLFESKQAEIRATIGERPDVEAAEAAVDAASTKVDQARAELARLEAELSTARSRRAEAQEAADRWRGQNDLLSAPVSGPTAEDVAAAEAEVESARVALDAGRAFAQHDLLEASLSDSTQEADGHESKAENLRAAARAVPAKLAEILERRDLPNLSVDEGRLCVVRDGGVLEDYDRLSLGARTRLALEVAMRATGGQTLPLDPTFWLALQPSAQLEVAEAAAEAGVYIVTEAPSDSPEIEVEHLGEDAEVPELPTTLELSSEMLRLSRVLDRGIAEMRDRAVAFAQAEHEYRLARATHQLTAGEELQKKRGLEKPTVDEKKAWVDLQTARERLRSQEAEGLKYAAMEAVRSRRGQLSALQTVANAFKEEAKLAQTGPQ